MAKKQYENFTIFGARIYGMRNLWQPATEYMGKPTQRPSYIAGFLTPKTRAHWSEEPIFAGVWGAMQKIYAATMNGMPYNMVDWPIRDGDIPAPGKPQADWAKGTWMFGGNSGDMIKVEIVQNGVPVSLVNRATVKPGDFVSVGGATAVKSNQPNGIKFYINTVLFMSPGEEIAVGNSVSGAELMHYAQQQGLNVTGFGGGGGFGGGQPGGFSPNPGGQTNGGFTPGNGGGFAPPQGGHAPVHPASPPNNGAGGGFVSPSNQGQPNPGFTQPGGPQPGQPGPQTTTFHSNPNPGGFGGQPQSQPQQQFQPAPNFNPNGNGQNFGR